MAVPNLGEIITTTLYNRSRMLADNVSENTALLTKLKMRGKVKPVSGGERIIQELSFQENDTYKRYSGYDTLDVRETEVISAAEYPWRQAAVAVMISGLEELQNAGREKQIDLLEARIEVAEATMMNRLSQDIYSDGTADNGRQINGLQALVPTAPTTGTVGGINRANFPFWRSQVETGTTATNIKDKMQALWVKQVRNMDKPDLIVLDNVFYANYWAALQDQQRFTDPDMAKMGFDNLKFNSAPVILDGGYGGDAPASTGHFLNCKYLFWRPHSQRNMVPLSPDRYSWNQDAMVRLLAWAGNLCMSNAFLQGKLTA